MKYIDADKLIALIDAKLEDLGLSGSVWVGRSVLQELKNDIITSLQKEQDMGEVSDGYHTFNELYYYRMLYNAAFFNLLPKEWVHKSKRHHTGEECFGGGWFIVMANLPTGQISNHYELKDWDLFQIPEKEFADEWDGHTPKEAAERLHKYLQQEQLNIDEIKREWYNKGYLKGRKESNIPARELGLPKSIDFQQEQPIQVNTLTWKDVNDLERIINNVHYEFRNGIGEKSFGEEVLERFMEERDEQEQPEVDLENKFGWHNVSEETPKFGDYVIVACKNKNKEDGIWLYDFICCWEGKWEPRENWETPLKWISVDELGLNARKEK